MNEDAHLDAYWEDQHALQAEAYWPEDDYNVYEERECFLDDEIDLW